MLCVKLFYAEQTMTLFRFTIFLVILFTSFNISHATTYCAYPPGAIYVEGDNNREWKMTSSKNRVITNSNQTAPTTHCSANFNNLGGLKSLEIIKKPSLNSASIPNLYTLSYKAEKIGHDTMSIRVIWFDRSNNVINSVIHYSIDVVDHDL